MADLLDVMKKLQVKNATMQADLLEFRQNIDVIKDKMVEEAKENNKKKERPHRNCASLEGAVGTNTMSGKGGHKKLFKENELHINNLEVWVDNNELINRFKQFGTIREARVVRDQLDRSKGFAFLCFETIHEAYRAMSEMNGQMIGEKAIYISLVELKPGQRGFNPNENNKEHMKDKIFVKNLVESITDEELKSHFIQFGGIVEAKVVLDGNGKSKGVGFVRYFSKKAADRARIQMNGRMIQHTPVYVSFAEIIPGKTKLGKPKPIQHVTLQKDKIFVSNLPGAIGNSELKDLFSRFGNISKASTIPGKNIGFVQFILAKDALQAVHGMNGHVIESKQIKVTLANNKPGQTNDLFYAPRKPTYLDEYDAFF